MTKSRSLARLVSRRSLLTSGTAAAFSAAIPKLGHARQRPLINDASRLNPTPVARHWVVTPDAEAGFVDRLRTELKEAAAAKRAFAVGAARHSMGGQSLPRDGTAVTLATARCELDTAAGTFRVNAGTRWHQAIAVLDPAGFSPAVMQSNSDFGVASTFCVNAHGWPAPFGPFGSTVRAIKMMLADGTIVTCSKTENAELFGLAMGGYGLFGVLLELDCEMVPNAWLKPAFAVMPAKDFGKRFSAAIDAADGIQMAYGRLSVARAGFFEQALMITYRSLPVPAKGLPPAGKGGFASAISREVYRAQVGSEAVKRSRWLLETVAGPKAAGPATRNALMNEPVANLAGRDRRRTDILHEYFVSPERFPEFLKACQDVIANANQEFLNVTLRYVAADPTSVLAFARERRIAAVMSFSQELTPEAEADMMRMTEALIDRVQAIGGAFYLPYRLHARRDQVSACYPNAAKFTASKLHYDPGRLFRNAMWDAYFA